MGHVTGRATIMNLFLWGQGNVVIQKLSPLSMHVGNMHVTWNVIVDVECMAYLLINFVCKLIYHCNVNIQI